MQFPHLRFSNMFHCWSVQIVQIRINSKFGPTVNSIQIQISNAVSALQTPIQTEIVLISSSHKWNVSAALLAKATTAAMALTCSPC